MRNVVTVQDVQVFFPHRKKSYWYKLLATVRGTDKRRPVTVVEFARYTGMSEAEVRAGMQWRGQAA